MNSGYSVRRLRWCFQTLKTLQGLMAAREMNLPAFAIPSIGRKRAEHDAKMIARLHQHKVDLVCLAGYLRIISPVFVEAFPNRILNVHPSLLPAFPGLEAQGQALHYGAKVAGCTVHFVDEAVDHGVIILQKAVSVHDDDTEETLSARILEQEHRAYPEAIAAVLSEEVHHRESPICSPESRSSAGQVTLWVRERVRTAAWFQERVPSGLQAETTAACSEPSWRCLGFLELFP